MTFSPEDRERAMRQIKALMAKTTQNGCSEEEAMAAAEAVSRLLNKYELDLTDIELRESTTSHETVDTRVKSVTYMDYVVTAIAELMDCKVWVQAGEGAFGGRVFHFLGLDHDVVVAKYIYSICDRAIIFAWEDHKREIDFTRQPQSKKGKIKDSFQLGMASRLASRLRGMKKKQKEENMATTGRDLVVVKSAIVDEAFAELGITLGKARGGNKSINYDSHYQAGSQAGDRVNLNKGVTGAKAGGQIR